MRALAGATLALAVLAGCGGASRQSGPPSLAEGARVFASSCSGCHTLQPSTSGRVPQGGPLVGYRLTLPQLESFTKAMPTARRLGRRELEAVVAYIAHAQRAGGTKR
jgi:mono/diheme cytochrome c family protein